MLAGLRREVLHRDVSVGSAAHLLADGEVGGDFAGGFLGPFPDSWALGIPMPMAELAARGALRLLLKEGDLFLRC